MSVTADDRDDHFNYFGDWLLLSTGNPAIHDGTMSQTNQVSAGATFTFTGTQISVFGVVRSLPAGATPPSSTYKVDGGDVVSYVAPNLTSGEGDHMLFFSSGNLASAQHVLLINVTGTTGQAPYLLDYVTYSPASSPTPSKDPTPTSDPPPSTPTPTQPAQPPSTPSSSPQPQTPTSAAPAPSSSPSSSPSSPSSSQVSSSSPSSQSSLALSENATQVVGSSSAPFSSSSSSSGQPVSGTGLTEGASGGSVRSANNVGPIVGGVLGGIILLILIAIAVFIWRRRRRNAPGPVADYYASPPPPPPVTSEVITTPGITPYLLTRDESGFNGTGAQGAYSADPFASPSDPDTGNSGAAPYIATVYTKARSPDRLVPNRYVDVSSPEPSDSAYAPSTEPSERSWLRRGQGSSEHTSSSGSRIAGPRGPRDDIKGALAEARQLPSRPPAQHSDSGVRFGGPRSPRTEAMSEVMSEIPPAYTAN